MIGIVIFMASIPIKCIDQIPIPSVAPPESRQKVDSRLLEIATLPALSRAIKEAINATIKEIPINTGSHDTCNILLPIKKKT